MRLMAARREIEVKLLPALPEALGRLPRVLRSLGLEPGRTRRQRVVDAYLDTADWSLYRAGYACRVRWLAGAAVLTLKALRLPRRGLSVREELEEELPGKPRDLAHPPVVRLASKLSALTMGRPLQVLFILRQDRRTWDVHAPGGLELAVSADLVRYRAGRRRAAERVVELELHGGTIPSLRRLAERLAAAAGCLPAVESKFQRGLRFARLRPPVPCESCRASGALQRAPKRRRPSSRKCARASA